MKAVLSRCTDAAVNIALEHWLLTSHEADFALLWRNTPAVVIGRHQNAWHEVDVQYARERNIPVLRRSSGGGTVYHDLGCLLYSFITPRGAFDRRRHVKRIADALQPLVTRRLLVNDRSDIVMTSDDPGSRSESQPPLLKVGGSAFRLHRNSALHHGTVLLNSDLRRVASLCRLNEPLATPSNAVASVRSPVGNAMPNIDPHSAFETAAGAVLRSLDVRDPVSLTAEDILALDPSIARTAQQLRSSEWTFGNYTSETPIVPIKNT